MMNPILRNILAVIVGIIGGALVNMAIIMISGAVIPPPDGVDTNDLESIKANIHLYQPIHFIFPFLAHALGSSNWLDCSVARNYSKNDVCCRYGFLVLDRRTCSGIFDTGPELVYCVGSVGRLRAYGLAGR